MSGREGLAPEASAYRPGVTSPGAGPEGRIAAWLAPLAATLVIQTAAAFMTRVVPTIAPALLPALGLTDASIGYLAAATTAGSIAFLVSGSPLIWQVGPIRSLQIGLGLGLVGLALLALPFWQAAVLASLLIGLGYGPSSPAGSDILQRHSPARHRNLIFSLKQAGVPLGGVLAGLALPPIVEAYGWRPSLAVSAVAVLVAIALVQPLRGPIDVGRRPSSSITVRTFLSANNLLRPLRALQVDPRLMRLSLVGACLAFAQGCWFAFLVTYLVGVLGYSLTVAGAIFGLMQATGVVGRVALGWLSDRLGSGLMTLRLVTITGAATCAVAAMSGEAWPVWAIALLAGVAGVTVAGWNGVQSAEIARLAPPGLVGETAAGATVILFLGLVAGPVLFGAMVAASGSYAPPFAAIAVTTLAAVLALPRPGRPEG